MILNLPETLPATDQVHAILVDLDLPAELMMQLGGLLSQAESNRAERLGTAELRQRFIASHGILRILLGSYLEMQPGAVVIQTGQYGKPFTDGMEFSLSHTCDLAVMAFNRSVPVGVDVEMMDARTNLAQVASLAFSPAEFESWQALPEDQKRKAFYQTWTYKEALLKALGTGMRMSPRKFSVRVGPVAKPCLVEMDDPAFTSLVNHTHLYRLEAGENASAGLAVLGDAAYQVFEYRLKIEDVTTLIH